MVEVVDGSPAEASGISVSFGAEAAFVAAVDAPRLTPPAPRVPRARARARARGRPRLPLGAPSPSIAVLVVSMKQYQDRPVGRCSLPNFDWQVLTDWWSSQGGELQLEANREQNKSGDGNVGKVEQLSGGGVVESIIASYKVKVTKKFLSGVLSLGGQACRPWSSRGGPSIVLVTYSR